MKSDYALERALIFLRLRLSLRERFFFHFSLILDTTISSDIMKTSWDIPVLWSEVTVEKMK